MGWFEVDVAMADDLIGRCLIFLYIFVTLYQFVTMFLTLSKSIEIM